MPSVPLLGIFFVCWLLFNMGMGVLHHPPHCHCHSRHLHGSCHSLCSSVNMVYVSLSPSRYWFFAVPFFRQAPCGTTTLHGFTILSGPYQPSRSVACIPQFLRACSNTCLFFTALHSLLLLTFYVTCLMHATAFATATCHYYSCLPSCLPACAGSYRHYMPSGWVAITMPSV